MTGHVYLYGWGRTKHIADPAAISPRRSPYVRAYCGGLFQTDAEMVYRFRLADRPERAVERQRGLPVCKHCERDHKKATTPVTLTRPGRLHRDPDGTVSLDLNDSETIQATVIDPAKDHR